MADIRGLTGEQISLMRQGKDEEAAATMNEAQLQAAADWRDMNPYTPPKEQSKTMNEDGVPKWGAENPNLYGATMALVKTLPTLGAFAKGTGAGIGLAGALNATSGALDRYIHEKPTSSGDVVLDFGKGMAVEGTGRALGATAGKVLDIPAVKQATSNLGKKLYESAFKFSNSPNVLTPSERTAIINTVDKYGFKPNEESWLRLKDMVKTNSGKVDDVIEKATLAGDTIPANNALAAGSLSDLITRGNLIKRAAPNYTDDVYKTLAPYTVGDMTPLAMNTEKKFLQKELEAAYGNNTLNEPKVQTQKQVSAGMRKVLEDMYPEIKNLNKDSSELLALSDHLARSIGRVGNRDIIGLGDKVTLNMMSQIGDGTLANSGKLGAALNMLMTPMNKARLARVLYKANTGKDLPMSQWQKGLKYIGQAANSAPVRAGFDGAILGMGE